jgi:hypothetical protein
MLFRKAELSDIAGMARLRANDSGSEEYWRDRIQRYLIGQLHPRQALAPRVGFVCVDGEQIVGLVAGHLTRRFGCDGELEWISVKSSLSWSEDWVESAIKTRGVVHRRGRAVHLCRC